MDIFSESTKRFSNLPGLGLWEDAITLFRNTTAGKPRHWLIPARVCEAIRDSQENVISAVIAIGCAHISILLVDDMLDDDARGEYHRLGMPATANLACAFQSAALFEAAQCNHNPASQIVAINRFNDMFRFTAWGQLLDTQAVANEDAYWKIATTKSSPFFGTACLIGALAGGSTIEVAEQLYELGCLYGEMVQIHDDMHDVMETPANPDWVQGRSPLPILFASQVEHPKKKQFLELSNNILNPNALQDAQEILIACGAISYCANQLIKRHEQASNLLKHIPIANHSPIALLLEEIINPVYELLNATVT